MYQIAPKIPIFDKKHHIMLYLCHNYVVNLPNFRSKIWQFYPQKALFLEHNFAKNSRKIPPKTTAKLPSFCRLFCPQFCLKNKGNFTKFLMQITCDFPVNFSSKFTYTKRIFVISNFTKIVQYFILSFTQVFAQIFVAIECISKSK